MSHTIVHACECDFEAGCAYSYALAFPNIHLGAYFQCSITKEV